MQDLQLLLLQVPIANAQLLLDGLWIGAVLTLPAAGMMLLWRTMKVANLAQGELVVLGGFVTLLVTEAGLPPLLGIPAAALVLAVFGWMLHRLLLRHVIGTDMISPLLATFGLALLLRQSMIAGFGPDVRTVENGLDILFPFNALVTVPQARLLAFILSVTFLLALWLLLRQTAFGQTIHAGTPPPCPSSHHRDGNGPDTERARAAIMAINAALCGVAGALLIFAWSIHPHMGLPHTLRAFTMAMAAMPGSLAAIFASGLGLSVAEHFITFLLGPGFQLSAVFLLLLVVLFGHRISHARKPGHLIGGQAP